jgi:prepilin-type N-terminal cleavage/methylation domain-containing protein
MLRGLTLIEIIVVITIGAILAAAAVPIATTLQASAQLNESATALIQTLRIARQHSIDRVNDAPHGVYMIQAVQNDSYVLYQGDSYAVLDPDADQITVLPPSINLTTTLTGNEIHFSSGFGIPDTNGSITLTHATRGVKTITINAAGTIEEQ